MPTAESRLIELGLTLPAARVPAGVDHVPYVRTGNLIFVGGDVSRRPDGTVLTGKLGENMTSADVIKQREVSCFRSFQRSNQP